LEALLILIQEESRQKGGEGEARLRIESHLLSADSFAREEKGGRGGKEYLFSPERGEKGQFGPF